MSVEALRTTESFKLESAKTLFWTVNRVDGIARYEVQYEGPALEQLADCSQFTQQELERMFSDYNRQLAEAKDESIQPRKF